MSTSTQNTVGRARVGSPVQVILLTVSLTVLTACSGNALADLGGRASDWIDEVATTRPPTTTTLPSSTRPASSANWVNDQFGAPPPRSEPGEVLAVIFARSDGDSRYLQSSRAEIVLMVPDIEFPLTVPAEVSFVSSQLVVERQSLRLSRDPTVAFGLWSVEPYTRSRSVGQVAVLTASSDPAAAELANDPNTPPTCVAFSDVEGQVCGIESFVDWPVWRLETASQVTHLWYQGSLRYEMTARSDLDESLVHTMIRTMAPLADDL